jgi:crotonobetainyl-CoA:carnitine CoA-transferase CaiB-like acyl-CoA transferase
MNTGKRPLSGTTIIDLTRLYPGPLATMMLAELGADVIRIEHPDHPDLIHLLPPMIRNESVAYLSLNRSKRGFALDLGKDGAGEVFLDLVARADMVVEQFRPGVMDRMGIGYRDAVKHNPAIIYLALTGFGQEGPCARMAGHDINYISRAGLLSLLKKENEPLLPAFQIADVAGGCYMTLIGALSALLYRERTGRGQQVDISMADAMLPLLALQVSRYWGMEEGGGASLEMLTGDFPFYGLYECADGKYIGLGALEPKFWPALCRFLNREDWLSRVAPTGGENAQIKKEMTARFREKTRDEWVREAEGHDICLSPVNELEDLEKDPHLLYRNMILSVDHGKGLRLKGIGIPLKYSESGPRQPFSAPRPGEHSLAILQELGYPAEKIEELIENRTVYCRE